MVPNTEVNMAEGQYERSVEDTFIIENVSDILETGVHISIRPEVLMGTSTQTMPMGILDAPTAKYSSDFGSLENYGANGLCDGDLAKADQQPGHLNNSSLEFRSWDDDESQ